MSYIFPASAAMANYPFAATGATSLRTMPDRLAEVKNVKDFGAVGDGSTDDTSAIQAAVNWTSGANRGTIYFPIGAYKVTSPITYNYNGNLSICFRGEIGTSIVGNFNGYVFDRNKTNAGVANNTPGGRIFERLTITNSGATGGCIRMGSTIGGVVRDCILSGWNNITTEDDVGVSSRNIAIRNCQFSGGGAGSNHIIIGGGGVIEDCGTTNQTETAVRAYGAGLHVAGNRWERNDCAYLLGLDSGGNAVGLSGFSIASGTFEGNLTAIYFAGPCDGFYIGSLHIMGHDSTNGGMDHAIASTSWSGGTATLTLAGALAASIPTGSANIMVSGVSVSGYNVTSITGTVVNSTTITYPVSGPLANSSGGVVNLGTQYGIRIAADCAKNGVICASDISSWMDRAGTSIANATSRTNLVFANFTSIAGGGAGTNWVLPTNAYTALFDNCNTYPIWTFSQLPSGGNVLEGDEFDISDSNTAAWGATAAGSGSNRVRVRYNGTNWTVMGK